MTRWDLSATDKSRALNAVRFAAFFEDQFDTVNLFIAAPVPIWPVEIRRKQFRIEVLHVVGRVDDLRLGLPMPEGSLLINFARRLRSGLRRPR